MVFALAARLKGLASDVGPRRSKEVIPKSQIVKSNASMVTV